MRSVQVSNMVIQWANFVWRYLSLESLRRAYILSNMEERLLDLVDYMGRTQEGMTAQFGFLESQYQWFLVQSLYILIIFCIVC